MSRLVKYRFAACNGKTVDINDITEIFREENTFFCLECSEKVSAHLKGSRSRHFHHVNYTHHDSESYLHRAAKQILKETYDACLLKGIPFFLEYEVDEVCDKHYRVTGITCSPSRSTRKYDLTQRFKKIVEELRMGSFKPDLCFVDEEHGDLIYCEIFVTHKSGTNKIGSGRRIIEIEIKSEEDLVALRNPILSCLDAKIIQYNFTLKEVRVDRCGRTEKGCREWIEYFLLYKSGRYIFGSDYLENIVGLLIDNDNILLSELRPKFNYDLKNEEDKRNFMIEKMRAKNYKLRDCSLCRYQGINRKRNREKDHFCKFKKIEVDRHDADFCEYFRE